MRGNGNQLESHVVNTVFKFLGKALKELFKIATNERGVVEWLKIPEQGDKYRLYLFLAFSEQVSILDTDLGFIPYKTLLQSFQDSVIPEMVNVLMPFFMNCS